jgi:hypothetical protein
MCVFLFLLASWPVFSQPFRTINYSAVDTVEWMEETAKVTVLDTNHNHWVSLTVHQDSSEVMLNATPQWPKYYSCYCKQTIIDSVYRFSEPIVKYRPVFEQAGDTVNRLQFEFQLKRKGSIFDFTGIFAIRHLIPRRETFVFIQKPNP